MIKARCVIFEQTEVSHIRCLLVILDGASGPHALRACLAPAGGAVNLQLGRKQHDLINLFCRPALACMIISF